MTNSRAKGCRCEREWRDVLKKHGYAARRGQQFSGDSSAPDVVGGPAGFRVEVKCCETGNPWTYMKQAEHDAGGLAVPYVAMKRNHKPWLVVLRAEDFLLLVKMRDMDFRLLDESVVITPPTEP